MYNSRIGEIYTTNYPNEIVQELSYRKQIARQLHKH